MKHFYFCCNFTIFSPFSAAPKVLYLGHVVVRDGIRVNPEKVKAIKENYLNERPHQTGPKFWDFWECAVYSKFIRGYSDLAEPLHKISEKKSEFLWITQCQNSYEQYSEILWGRLLSWLTQIFRKNSECTQMLVAWLWEPSLSKWTKTNAKDESCIIREFYKWQSVDMKTQETETKPVETIEWKKLDLNFGINWCFLGKAVPSLECPYEVYLPLMSPRSLTQTQEYTRTVCNFTTRSMSKMFWAKRPTVGGWTLYAGTWAWG